MFEIKPICNALTVMVRIFHAGLSSTVMRKPLNFLIQPTLVLFDSILITAAILFVVETLGKGIDTERVITTAISVVSIRWGVEVLFRAEETFRLAPVTRDLVGRGTLPAAIYSIANTVPKYLIAFLMLFVVARTFSPANMVEIPFGLATLLIVFTVQLLALFSLLSIVVLLMIRYRVNTAYPFIIVLLILGLLSPVMFQFKDLGDAPGPVLTSLNPVPHFLAAYQNTMWYARPISLQVLPYIGLVSLLFAFVQLLTVREKGQSNPASYRSWRPLPDGFSGWDFYRIVRAVQGPPIDAERELAVEMMLAGATSMNQPLSVFVETKTALVILALATLDPRDAVRADQSLYEALSPDDANLVRGLPIDMATKPETPRE